jgi:4-amino-4-deoxy-L-arabinose transferase-like glycosyltransferase
MSAPSDTALRRNRLTAGLAALLAFAAGSNRRAAAVLALVALAAFLPGFFQIPPIDRDEAYFAQATKQMIETGDYVDIRYQDDVRYRKPVGIYWLQAAAVQSAGALGVADARGAIWLYRMPSLIGAIGATLATFWCALAFVSRRGAILAALMMATSPLLGVEARLAKTDAALLFTIVLAMGALARVYLSQRQSAAARAGWGLFAVFWTALAGGILIKGPLILMVAGLAAATLSIADRSARWLLALRPLLGAIWVALIASPWFIAIALRSGGAFFANSVGSDMMAKVAGGQESHGAPPGFYFVLFFATFFPGSMLAALSAPAVWAARRAPTTRFLLAWLAPSWLVFELVATKLPHYVLPLYPAIAILIAGAIESNALSRRVWLARGAVWWFLIPAIAGAVAIGVAIEIGGAFAFLAWPVFAAAILCGVSAWRAYGRDGAEPALLRAAAAAILTAIGFFAVVAPSLAPAFPSVALAATLDRAACPHPVVASVGYQEPSLVFLAGTGTRLTDAAGAADFLSGGECRFAFVETGDERAFTLRAEAIGLRATRGPRVAGYNISNGQPIVVAVFQSAPAP